MIVFNIDAAQQVLTDKLINIKRSIASSEEDIASLQEQVYRAVRKVETSRLVQHNLEKAIEALNAKSNNI